MNTTKTRGACAMPGKALRILPALIFLALLGLPFPAPSPASVTGKPHDLDLNNPKATCLHCHDLHQVKLGEGYAHNLKRANEIAVCYQCHAGALNDYSTIDPSLPNRTSFYSRYDVRAEFQLSH